MAYEKIQTKFAAASDFTINAADIDRTFDPLKEHRKSPSNWILGLVNITNEAYLFASVTDRGGNYGKWFGIPATRKNCETSYDDCIGKGKWTAILAVPSNSSSFSIRIATQPDEFGNATGTEFLEITPSDTYEGGIIGVGG